MMHVQDLTQELFDSRHVIQRGTSNDHAAPFQFALAYAYPFALL